MRLEEATSSGLLEDTSDERRRVRELVRSGRWLDAERDVERLATYVGRHLSVDAPPGAEAIQGGVSELQAVRFLTLGTQVRRAVGYVEVITPEASTAGTGFLVSPRVFITNAHVIPDATAAAAAVITFDRELDERGRPRPLTTYVLDPAALALFSDEDNLDYALVAVGNRTTGGAAPDELGFCPLSDRGDKHAIGMPVNIVQHPRQWLKMVALRNNFLSFRTETTLLYETDTDEGSSGAPVFNDDWEVVALHHWGQPHADLDDDQGNPFPPTVNEGIRISAIYRDLTAQLERDALSSRGTELLRGVLSAAASTPVAGDRPLGPPRLSSATSATAPPAATTAPASQEAIKMTDRDTVRVVVPLEISVRLGTGGDNTAGVFVPAPSTPGPRPLTRGSEAVKIDLDYSNRDGYDPDFIPGATVALPTVRGALASQVAPLRSGPDPVGGELRYEHFSLKMNESTRVAIFTATNIDGPTYLRVDRATGQVADSEGERWFNDTRISPNYHLDQSFYSNWSHVFDRGHLTRRTDPTWGTNAEAERANADTFHFTNCSPQHFRFNQTATYWQGLERYVLENGVLSAETGDRLCVLQGPIYDDTADRWADDVQIPSSFWKIVVWMGADDLKAVGLIADQADLLDEFRKSLGPPRDLPAVDVKQWRVAIPLIEQRTGLDFGNLTRNADTITDPDQPEVGAEAVHRLTSLEDIILG